ncbi:hypothetical protein CYMTET_8192 [Cymbomonas tetramitiformis]|uniref:Uncharacterized protein n=1 Tax=Cymbomonas tetramitiformis TaxID=36881 RepID=A0AAE0LGQ5_9CHLO|nr:hypothetical protein CYMTET_8192 [Cymbomonas tetramitiformis]
MRGTETAGANQIVALNERLGSGNTVQGTFFSQGAHGGDDSMAMVQCSSQGLTEVTVLDHDESGYCNFETAIHNNDNGGIIQAECVGVHVSNDGFVLYGCHLEAAMQAVADGISLDNLSRVLMDVQNDTSKIMDSVVSSHQKIMLEITYDGDAIQRPKYTLIFAQKVRKSGLTRSVQVADLMDREVSENELKQVLGDTQRGVNLSSSELLVIGKHGMLVAGPNSERHEVFLNAYLGLMARNSFMNHLFQRTFIVVDTLKRIRYLIENYQSDPNSLHNIRTMLSVTSGDIILLTEIQSYLYSQCFNVIVVPPAPPRTDIGATALFEILDMPGTSKRLNRRVHGMRKTINVLKGQLQALEAMADRVSAGMTSRVMEAVEANTKNMDDQYRYNLRASSALDILNVLMAGSLAFSIIDRVHGLYLGVAHEIAWANTFMKPIYNTPFALFALNLGWWGMIGSFIYLLMAHISERASHVLCISFEVNTRLDFKALMVYLETKKVEVEDSQLQSSYQSDSTIESRRNLMYTKKVVWDEVDSIRWRGRPPRIEILVDEEYHHLLSVYIAVNTRQSRITVPEVPHLSAAHSACMLYPLSWTST